jgi:hypothetical protein
MFNKGFESLIAHPTSNSLAAGESQMPFKKSQDQLQNGQSTVFQKARAVGNHSSVAQLGDKVAQASYHSDPFRH